MPIFQHRPIEHFPIGNLPLFQHQHRLLNNQALCHPHAWLDETDCATWLVSENNTLVDATGRALAWKHAEPDLGHAMLSSRSFVIVHPWDVLRANEQWLASLNQHHIAGEVHPQAVIEGFITLGEGSRLLPGVFIEGNVIIGKNCKIGPNCYLRGHTSIGDHCHIGQAVEIKNTIILDHSSIGHLSYVGDSVIGSRVNFGAGTITSNLRHDGKTHRSRSTDAALIDTKRRKLGAIVGDGVHTGIHTSIYPGRQLWPQSSTRPGAVVLHDLLSPSLNSPATS